MGRADSLNLPRLVEQAKAAYPGQADRLTPADAVVAARRARHLSWFVRLSLDEPETMRRMQEIAGRLQDSPRLDAVLPAILDGALTLTGADFGNVQLVDPASGALVLVTQSGFGTEFTDYFAFVDDEHSACGRAARTCALSVVADVTTDPDFAPHREIAAAAGFRAVQSTPLADSRGRLIGMVSTHWQRPGRPPARNMRILELFGDLAGEAIARHLGPASGSRPDPDGTDEDDLWHRPDGELPAVATPPDAFADEVVGRLFTAGLNLASARDLIEDGAAGKRVATAVDEMDRAIHAIRAGVFPGVNGQHRRLWD
jgi:GAF domain-containing protein